MKPFPFTPDAPPMAVGEWLQEHGWTLPEVLEWFAGEPCRWHGLTPLHEIEQCKWCYSEPAAEFGRDVLAAFIIQGGATHERQVEWVDWMQRTFICKVAGSDEWCVDGRVEMNCRAYFHSESHANIHFKRRILRLFSGPVEDKKCHHCDGSGRIEDVPAGSSHTCWACNRSGIIPGGGVRIVRMKEDALGPGMDLLEEITPEQLLPPESHIGVNWASPSGDHTRIFISAGIPPDVVENKFIIKNLP